MAGFHGDSLGPRVLGQQYKPPPEIPESLLKSMRARITRVKVRAEGSYIPDPEPLKETLEKVEVDLADLYAEPEYAERDDELTPEQRQVLRDL